MSGAISARVRVRIMSSDHEDNYLAEADPVARAADVVELPMELQDDIVRRGGWRTWGRLWSKVCRRYSTLEWWRQEGGEKLEETSHLVVVPDDAPTIKARKQPLRWPPMQRLAHVLAECWSGQAFTGKCLSGSLQTFRCVLSALAARRPWSRQDGSQRLHGVASRSVSRAWEE